nr:hypothetical protein [Tanacetum cinerariifolium]
MRLSGIIWASVSSYASPRSSLFNNTSRPRSLGKRLCWIEHSTIRLTFTERDLKSFPMESRHFRDDLHGSLFQQSGSVETEGQSSSVAHKESVTTHHFNTDPDAEQQGESPLYKDPRDCISVVPIVERYFSTENGSKVAPS